MMASPTTSGSRPDLVRPPSTFILFQTFQPTPFATNDAGLLSPTPPTPDSSRCTSV